MITWIKFSERQPEKAGDYLHFLNELATVQFWMGPDRGWVPCRLCGHEVLDNPDYWAEINPPGDSCDDEELCKMIQDRFYMPNGGFISKEFMEALKTFFKKETPMPEKPLCKDCKWINRLTNPFRFWCDSPKAKHSLVDDEPIQSCNELRSDLFMGDRSKFCGPEGRWFEAKSEAEPVYREECTAAEALEKRIGKLSGDEPEGTSTAGRVTALENGFDLMIQEQCKLHRRLEALESK